MASQSASGASADPTPITVGTNETVVGGTGNDIYIVTDNTSGVFENPNGGNDTILVDTPHYYLLANSSVEVMEPGPHITDSIWIIGNRLSQTLIGTSGNDSLDGLGGGDTLIGGSGNDLYGVFGPTDHVLELAGGGNDTVIVVSYNPNGSTSFSLDADSEVENLKTFGITLNQNINISGNHFAQSIIGNAGNNQLFGGGGGDSIIGGDGDDTVMSGSLSAEGTGNSFLSGGNGNDRIYGGTGNDSLTGGAGDDFLNSGSAGADTMVGGTGNDTYIVASTNAGLKIIENTGEGTDTVFAAQSFVLGAGVSVEVLATTLAAGTAPIHLTGNELAQSLTGNAGDNLLNGGGGADTMIGLGGNDMYLVDNSGDTVVEAANGGTDTVFASVSYALKAGSSVEWLATSGISTTTAINLTGNELSQAINGNNGANILQGGLGDDTLSGYGGDDRLVGGAGHDVLDGGTGNDTMVYNAVSESTSINHDLVKNMNLTNEDKFQFTFKPTAIDAAVTHGALNLATFDKDLSTALGSAQLGAHHAVLFTPDAGDQHIAGHLFLVVDANGVAGYQAGQDYVIELVSATGTLTLADFA